LLDGFTDYIFLTVDMSDPTRPREVGRFWLPGMNAAAGETPSWPASRRYGLHHAIVHSDTAYAAWRDAGIVVIDVSDRSNPRCIVRRNWSPPFGGGTHNCLPLPDRHLLVVLDEAVLDPRRMAKTHLDLRQSGKVEPGQHLDIPFATRGGLSGEAGPFRAA
jgi:hypothetical protein